MLKIRYLLLLVLLVGWFPASAEETKTLVWPDGTRYVGGVIEGKRTGKGTIFWQDGTRFVGTFVDDKRHGPGTMILPDGTVYNGYFENDALVQTAAEGRSEPTAPVAEISADDVTEDTTITVAEVEPAIPEAEAEPEVVAASQAEVTEATSEDTTEIELPMLTVAMRQQIQAAIDNWALAWSNQDVDRYLEAYADNFEIPGRQSRRQWEGLRRSRLSRPSRINITLTYDTFEVIAPDQVQVDFNQVYDSNLFSDRTNKRLVMVQEDSSWKILTERSI